MYLPLTLISTVCIWIFFGMILLSNIQNPLNRLCFCAGILFSLGTFKEYFYYDLGPQLTQLPLFSPEKIQAIYALMTNILYLWAMPATFLFALRFYKRERFSHLGRLTAGILLPALVLLCLFPPIETYTLQRESLLFWVAFCGYNLTYGVLVTLLMVRAVNQESTPSVQRQKRFVALLMLPLLWYWLITIFVFHTMRLYPLLKWWKGSLLLVILAILLYLYLAFHEGIMGLRLNTQHYRWELESEAAFRGAQFLSHTLKRDLVKISWCAHNLQEKFQPPPIEISILSEAAEHLQGLSQRILLYSGEVIPKMELCPVGKLLEGFAEEFGKKGLCIHSLVEKDTALYCDPYHTREVLRNLLENAWESISGSGRGEGTVEIDFHGDVRKRGYAGRFDLLTVCDNGPGIPPEDHKKIFFPYHTGKAQEGHLGLGLHYCRQVMRSYGGWIESAEPPGGGLQLLLLFPKKR